MKRILSYFIKYHVAVNVIIAAFVIFGIIGALSLKSSFFPLVDSKVILINIIYPGASPQQIEEGVVLKIEDNLKGIEGIDRITSTSQENSGTITVEILKGYNIDFLLLEVKNAVDRVPNFPGGMEPLVVAKQEPSRPTISFSVSGDNISLKTLKEIARDVENDLRAMEGISQIALAGFPAEEIEISVDQNDLLAYNVSFQEVAEAVAGTNILATGGKIKTEQEEYLIRANIRSYYADELAYIPIKSLPDGTQVELQDVAEVRDRFNEVPNASYFNGERSVTVTVTSTNAEDLISSAAKVRDYIDSYNQSHNNVTLNVIDDQSITLNQRTALLTENAIIGIALVLLFLSIFLNTRLAFWVAFGLPIAFLGMFIFAGQFDVTINVLSLFGMIIVIGILVDDGIVIAENIYQHYERGKNPIQAAVDGTLEVIPPIISAITTTILAFSTFQFLDGRIGEFFSEVSVIVMLTLIVSLVEALIILPAHLAHSKALQKEKPGKKKNLLSRAFAKLRHVNAYGDRFMVWMRDNAYAPILRFSIRNKLLAFSFFLAALLLTIGSIGGGIIGVTLFPSIASDRVTVTLTMPNGTNEQITYDIISMIQEKSQQVNEKLTDEYLDGEEFEGKDVIKNLILNQTSASDAVLEINLLPGEERPDALNASIFANDLREAVGDVPEAEQLIFNSGGNFGGSPVAVSLISNDISQLKAATEDFKAELQALPELKDITDNDPQGIKEIKIELKENAYNLGLTVRSIMNQVRSAFFGLEAQRIQRGQDEIKIWVRYDREERSSIRNLDDFRLMTPEGNLVPFRDVVDYSIERGEVAINHLNGQREIRVSADLKDPNGSATDILANIRENIMPEITKRYSTVSTNYENGQQREAQKISSSAGVVFPIVLVLIYIVIAFTFRSGTQPIMLILLIPFSLVAVGWGHWIHGFPVNVLSLLGIIALIGIMVNDGLVLIGKFNSYLREGLDFDDALFKAGKSRFRAIFLTSLTTIAGLAPLIFEQSRQAQFLKPMAISISYGIGFATLLTLLLLPMFLSFSNNMKVWAQWLWTGEKPKTSEVTTARKEQKQLAEYENRDGDE